MDVESFSLEKIKDGKGLMIGDYKSIFLEKDPRFDKDTVFYHNPYMNQMWSKIEIFTIEN